MRVGVGAIPYGNKTRLTRKNGVTGSVESCGLKFELGDNVFK